jgi:hypothetical protein
MQLLVRVFAVMMQRMMAEQFRELARWLENAEVA